MQPDLPTNGTSEPNPSAARAGGPLQPVVRNTGTRESETVENAQRAAVADVTRGQIDRIYARDSPYKQFEAETGVSAEDAPAQTQAEHFKRYHTAWQDYYQKYYESYYTQAVRQTQAQLQRNAELTASGPSGAVYGAPAAAKAETRPEQAVAPSSAVRQLQSQFKRKVSERAARVRHSRHFWPLITAASVALVFLFLQYNRLLIANVAAYVSPGTVDPQNIIVDPSADTKVGPDPLLIIPKINVDAPVDYSVTTYDNDTIEAHLKNGVVKYAIPGANAFPGQVGNLVIGGHSSNDVFDDGNYKFVFVQLPSLVVGDTFYLNYQGTRYTYHVTKTQTIDPDQINVLTAPVTTPTVTLVTCTPVGTAQHRLLVTGEQASPDPSTATAANNAGKADSTTLTGNSPTLLQRIFGA